MKTKGTLIAIEGIDGSGKSTLIEHIYSRLNNQRKKTLVITTCEKNKKRLYNSIMTGYSLSIHSTAAMFFYQMLHAHKADRASKAVESGKIVIADRWDFSFFVSHENFGFFSAEKPSLREDMSRLAFGNVKPDLGIYLNVSVENAIERRMWRKDVISDPDAEKKYYTAVTESYLRLVKKNGWEIVDANQTFSEVCDKVYELIDNLLSQ